MHISQPRVYEAMQVILDSIAALRRDEEVALTLCFSIGGSKTLILIGFFGVVSSSKNTSVIAKGLNLEFYSIFMLTTISILDKARKG